MSDAGIDREVARVSTDTSSWVFSELSDSDVRRHKAYLEFEEGDEHLLASLHELAVDHADEMIDALYEHFFAFDETRAFFHDPAVLQRVKSLQKEYFIGLCGGDYGAGYVAERLKVGAVHSAIGLEPNWYFGAFNFYFRRFGRLIFDAWSATPDMAFDRLMALAKIVFLDMTVSLDAYTRRQEMLLEDKQREALRELSTPVLQLRPGLLLLPIIGAIDSQRARQLTESLLRTIAVERASVAVVDITGVPAVDTAVANHLMQTVEASRLMGARVLVTGLSPEVAQTLVSLGLDLGRLETVGDLQGGIELADRLLGPSGAEPMAG